MAWPSLRRNGAVPLLAWLTLTAGIVSAQPKHPTPKTFRARRKALIHKLGGNPVLIFGAAASQEIFPFRQNNRFHYLTGITEPGAALLLIPARRRELLFLDPGPREMERWKGIRLKPGLKAQEATGFREIYLRKNLPKHLDLLLAGKPSPVIYLPLAPEEIGTRINDASSAPLLARQKDPLDGGTWRERRIRSRLLERYKGAEVRDASPVIRSLRLVKGPEEIEAMREAARISCLGMAEAMRATRPGVYEYEIEAAMAYVCRRNGGQGWAYSPIVGSGPNALVLHSDKNKRKVEAGDLILMDAGFFWNYYAIDITRTFPATGKFTPDQRKVYADLLKVQVEAIRRVKPGTSMIKLNSWVNGRLRAMGYGRYIAHFLGHTIGMAVHDPRNYNRPLRAGNVITIEPGLYLDDKGFGIRIEDTVLVTPTGSEVLSSAIPKDPEAIEALMKR